MQKSVKIILTQNNKFDLKVQCIISDSEDAWVNAINYVFDNVNRIGCYYHYIQDLKQNLKKGSLEIENYSNRKKQIINKLSLILLLYEGKMSKFDDLINYINEIEPELSNFIEYYFIKNKKKYFEDQTYNYDLLPDDCRSNSNFRSI